MSVGAIIAILFAAIIALSVMAGLCWRLSRIHSEASILAQCISDMLAHPDRAHLIAAETQKKLVGLGLWQS